MTDYISTADTAKAIRLELTEAFPKVRFSVRSKVYAGGSSITIRWTDGPTKEAVDDVVGRFASRGFDGSIDLGYSIAHYALPSGKIVGTKTSGTAGSGGYVAAHDDGPIAGATLVTFGAGFVFTERSRSKEVEDRLLVILRTRFSVIDEPLWMVDRHLVARAEEILAAG